MHVITGSELTESSLPDITTTGFILFLHLYCVSIEVYSSSINRQKNMSPVPVSLHSKMGFLVSTNSFHFPKLIIKNNYKDLCKLCMLSPANTNKMYHYLGFFLNPFSTMQCDPLLSALPSNTLGTEVSQLSLIHCLIPSTASHSWTSAMASEMLKLLDWETVFRFFLYIFTFFFQISHWLNFWIAHCFSKIWYYLCPEEKKKTQKNRKLNNHNSSQKIKNLLQFRQS